MTIRQYILLGLGEYLAMVTGILFATHGREKLLAVVIPLALVVPPWLFFRRRWVRDPHNPAQSADTARRPLNPWLRLILWLVVVCSSAWSISSYIQRGDWVGTTMSSIVLLGLAAMEFARVQRNRANRKASTEPS